jgi:hypothetical protein
MLPTETLHAIQEAVSEEIQLTTNEELLVTGNTNDQNQQGKGGQNVLQIPD